MRIYNQGKIYGPYLSKQDNRLRIRYCNKTISYPKYLVEISLNRYLTEDETVHHVDGNPLNNELSNLQILSRKEHTRQDVIRLKNIELICQWCKTKFIVEGNKIHNRNRKDRQSNSFCSRRCSGKYGAHVQNTGHKFSKVNLNRTYYKERDNRNIINEEQNIGESLTANTEA